MKSLCTAKTLGVVPGEPLLAPQLTSRWRWYAQAPATAAHQVSTSQAWPSLSEREKERELKTQKVQHTTKKWASYMKSKKGLGRAEGFGK